MRSDITSSPHLANTSLCRFSLKFQRIVQAEQKANFISRLHRGNLNIIPWPVIESKEFYDLFSTLKRQLDRQNVSHPTAGEFLHTMKTLMAKLKVRFPSLPSLHSLTFSNRLMIGAPFLVRYFYLLPSVLFILLNRDYRRPPRQGAIQPPSDCISNRILRSRARFRALEGSVIF